MGEKAPASLAAAFATPFREAEEGVAAALYEVRDPRPLYDLWTFGADTGVLFERGTRRKAGVGWIQGSFEATRPARDALALAARCTYAGRLTPLVMMPRWLSLESMQFTRAPALAQNEAAREAVARESTNSRRLGSASSHFVHTFAET